MLPNDAPEAERLEMSCDAATLGGMSRAEVANKVMYDAFEEVLDERPYSHTLQAVLTAIVADDDEPRVAKVDFGAASDADG
jgi:hypothetical protein